MNIYTRTGDKGQTSVIGGRVSKNHAQVEAYGTIDELNCFVGQAISSLPAERFEDLREHLTEIQNELFDCGSDLAFANPEGKQYKVTGDMITRLEEWIDRYDAENPDITRFILPGGTMTASLLHVCRTVCRRAERRVVTLAEQQPIHEEARAYLNRLSDFFFVAARTANAREGVQDVEYIRSAEVFRKKS
ncbi:cob(I)yrinic acid a,c-diamide adenosyltransferase [Paenibacillus gansuensis]|uniref:Corrinoid adenosyltransferase n=1 Tax=Paenibacillus gansuensis TaxID=306542 RepID=A0ABW5PFJ7_9BACL